MTVAANRRMHTGMEDVPGRPAERMDIHLGLYKRAGETWYDTVNYDTYIGTLPEIAAAGSREMLDMELVGSLMIPEQWRMGMARHADALRMDGGVVQVGSMVFIVEERGSAFRGGRTVAVTQSYRPREYLERGRSVPGLGYVTEHMAVSDLAGQITHVSTTKAPSNARIRQLKRGGLRRHSETPVEKWLEGLRRGFEVALASRRD